MIDVVYLYSAGSDTIELKYSLRSLEKHLTGFRNLYIVGDDPGFLKDVTIISHPNPHKGNRARNIYERILRACQEEAISDYFIYNSDDIFLLRNYKAINFPYYYCNTLEETYAKAGKDNSYKKYVEATLKALQEKGLPTINFNGHSPIVYHKALFIDIMSQFNWEVPKGYISKSIYCNTLKLPGEFLKDCKIFTPKTKTAIQRKIEKSPLLSTDDFGVNERMKEVLQELFPMPSRWEK